MLDLTRTTYPTVAELRERIDALLADIRLIETDLEGGIDPRLSAMTRHADARLDAAQEAVNQATLAGVGAAKRARARLNVARSEIAQAAEAIAKIENGTWQEVDA
jgi:hypothetical protein